MIHRNLRDQRFTSRMAAGNFLKQMGMKEESVDRWVGRNSTARVEANSDGKILVKFRRRYVDDRRY